VDATENLSGEFATATAFIPSDAQLLEIAIESFDNFLRVGNEQTLVFGHGLVV
jgi:hypothetical protein